MRAWARFYAELNDHLAPERQYQTLEKTFSVPGSVKDLIESYEVPHAEVELILVNGESVPFSRLIEDGDRVAVYPVFESIDIRDELRVRAQPLRDPRFVLDVHLGKLAAYLRMLGFDAVYSNLADDPELARVSCEQRRILLTRDRGLLMRGAVTHGYWLRQTDSRRQTEEVIRRFDLMRSMQPFTRCMACNAQLGPAGPEEVADRVLPRTAESFTEFQRCRGCRRVYWQGSHYRRMRKWVDELAGLRPAGPAASGSAG